MAPGIITFDGAPAPFHGAYTLQVMSDLVGPGAGTPGATGKFRATDLTDDETYGFSANLLYQGRLVTGTPVYDPLLGVTRRQAWIDGSMYYFHNTGRWDGELGSFGNGFPMWGIGGGAAGGYTAWVWGSDGTSIGACVPVGPADPPQTPGIEEAPLDPWRHWVRLVNFQGAFPDWNFPYASGELWFNGLTGTVYYPLWVRPYSGVSDVWGLPAVGQSSFFQSSGTITITSSTVQFDYGYSDTIGNVDTPGTATSAMLTLTGNDGSVWKLIGYFNAGGGAAKVKASGITTAQGVHDWHTADNGAAQAARSGRMKVKTQPFDGPDAWAHASWMRPS